MSAAMYRFIYLNEKLDPQWLSGSPNLELQCSQTGGWRGEDFGGERVERDIWIVRYIPTQHTRTSL